MGVAHATLAVEVGEGNLQAEARALRAQVWPLLESGAIKPVIHQVFEPSQAADAHTLMESNRHIGKLMLRWA